MTILPNTNYRFNEITMRTMMVFFIVQEQITIKIVWKHNRPQIVKMILREKKKKLQVFTFLQFKLYFKATVITVWYWPQNSQNREAVNKHNTLIWSISLPQRRQEYRLEENILLNEFVGKNIQLQAKEWNGNTFSHHVKNKFKIN